MANARDDNRAAVDRWIVTFLGISIILVLFNDPLGRHLRLAAATSLGLSALALLCTGTIVPKRWLTLDTAFVGLFCLFHFGLLVPIALGLPVATLNPGDEIWLYGEYTALAALASSLGLCALLIANLMVRRRRSLSDGEREAAGRKPSIFADPMAVGFPLLAVGLALWCLNAVTSGAVVLGGSYSAFLRATGSTSMPYAYLGIGFGMALAASSKHSRLRRLGLVLFGLWSLPAFMVGLRGEVLIPAAIFAVIAGRRANLRVRAWHVFALIGGLSLGSFVRVVRRFGFGTSDASLADLNPLNGLAEMGYTIRPVITVLQWHNEMGEPFVGPSTYVAPFRRLLWGNLMHGQAIPIKDDPSVFSSVISSRVGPIGGSQIAESYRSGGLLGVVLVMAVLGALIAILDTRRSAPLRDAIMGMTGYALLIWVRNDFTPMALELALIAGVVIVLRMFGLLGWFQLREHKNLSTNQSLSQRGAAL